MSLFSSACWFSIDGLSTQATMSRYTSLLWPKLQRTWSYGGLFEILPKKASVATSALEKVFSSLSRSSATRPKAKRRGRKRKNPVALEVVLALLILVAQFVRAEVGTKYHYTSRPQQHTHKGSNGVQYLSAVRRFASPRPENSAQNRVQEASMKSAWFFAHRDSANR